MRILSLYDGMSCGYLALQKAGIPIDRYVAYEIDKYAIQTSQHNFPMIEQMGDVFGADFTQYEGFDAVIGGSPCTYWSIAQNKNRETEASGMGWELFSQYVRAIHEAKPKWFIYENNKSMSKQIRASIDEAFGFEAVGINSALVSAQNRQRLYWVGMRNADGTYSKVSVEQPEDLGILLRDVLDTVVTDPVCVAERGRYEGGVIVQHFEARTDGKTNVLTTVQKDNNVAEPVRVGLMPMLNGETKDNQATRIYRIDGKSTTLSANGGGWGAKTGLYAEPVDLDGIYDLKSKDAYIQYDLSGKNHNSQDQRAYYTDSKHGTLNASSTESKTGVIETVQEVVGNKPVYEVKDGMITIKGKQYPIKLVDGFYIIRKLTVTECMRLQTVPEWYEWPVSDTQAYKMLGNGWTVDVIVHLMNAVKEAMNHEAERN